MPNRDVKQLESKIQRQILDYLDTVPCLYVIKVITASTRGVPDLVICYRGRFIGLEVKSTLNKATQIQMWNLLRITGAGGIGAVVRSVNDVKLILDKVGHE
jgi:hypothetical protein